MTPAALERIEIVVPERDADRKVELTEKGHILVMAAAGLEGGYNCGKAFGQLANWAKHNSMAD
jgi:hypothetical protein